MEGNGDLLVWRHFYKRASEMNFGSVHPITTVLGRENLTLLVVMVSSERPCLLRRRVLMPGRIKLKLLPALGMIPV